MEEEKIKVPNYLASKIRFKLQEEYGIQTDGNRFSKKELELIKELDIVPPRECGLVRIDEYLPNIRRLMIQSVGNTCFETMEIPSMSNEDVQHLAKCENLRQLFIINQSKIDCLDCSELNKLTSLVVKNNRGLKEVKGLNELTQLEEFICYGNTSLRCIDGLDKVIENNQDLCVAKLDIMHYPDAIGYNYKMDTENFMAKASLESLQDRGEATFVDPMLNKKVGIDCDKMSQFHGKCVEILNSLDIKDGETVSNIEKIHEYIMKNVQYVDEVQRENDIKDESRPTFGARVSSNNATSAIMNNRANNEGLSRAMQYLLKVSGINSKVVYCIKKSVNMNTNKEYNSVLCTEIDGQELYIDLTDFERDSESSILKTKEEMEEHFQFDKIHLANEISNKFLKKSFARDGGVQDLQQEIGKDVRGKDEKTEEKEI